MIFEVSPIIQHSKFSDQARKCGISRKCRVIRSESVCIIQQRTLR